MVANSQASSRMWVETHLGYEVEIIFVDDQDSRPMSIKCGDEVWNRVVEGGIEDRDRDAGVSQRCGGVESAERRIGLHLAPLLRVVRQMV